MYAGQRTLRLADGPDEVHWHVVGRNEIARYEGEDNDTTRAARTQEGSFSGPA
jgi:acyl-CoA dehydrogenase